MSSFYRIYDNSVKISFDPSKRARTLAERSLDFADAAHVFEGRHLTFEDARRDYGEQRLITVGFLANRLVLVGWTPRGGVRHVFSMRKANEREIAAYQQRLEQG